MKAASPGVKANIYNTIWRLRNLETGIGDGEKNGQNSQQKSITMPLG